MVVWRRSSLAACGVFGGALVLGAAALPSAAAATSAATLAAGCTATAQVSSQWGTGSDSGEVLLATVVNSSTVTSTRWAVAWTLAGGQRVVSGWNAALSTYGSAVSATSLAYNGTLAPGGSTTFGVQLAGTDAVPAMSCSSDAVQSVTLTESDSRSTVAVHLGQVITVELRADYRPITVTNPALVQESTSGGYPTGQPLVETYRAVAPGVVDLSTVTDAACLHALPYPCAIPQEEWTVHVDVVG